MRTCTSAVAELCAAAPASALRGPLADAAHQLVVLLLLGRLLADLRARDRAPALDVAQVVPPF